MITQGKEEDLSGTDLSIGFLTAQEDSSGDLSSRGSHNLKDKIQALTTKPSSLALTYMTNETHINLMSQQLGANSANNKGSSTSCYEDSKMYSNIREDEKIDGKISDKTGFSANHTENCDRSTVCNTEGADILTSDRQYLSIVDNRSSHSSRRQRWHKHLMSSQLQYGLPHYGGKLGDENGVSNYEDAESDNAIDCDEGPAMHQSIEPAYQIDSWTTEEQRGSQLAKRHLSVNKNREESNDEKFNKSLQSSHRDGSDEFGCVELSYPEQMSCNEKGEPVRIKIDTCLHSELPQTEPSALLDDIGKRETNVNTLVPSTWLQQKQLLERSSDSALDLRQLEDGGAILIPASASLSYYCNIAAPIGGSLSDSSHERPANKRALFERYQMEERVRNWKASNKILTRICDNNQFTMRTNCLERLSQKSIDIADTCLREMEEANGAAGDAPRGAIEQQQQAPDNHDLQNYAIHLSCLYKKNQTIMDSNTDFRALLYNIICCLLIQDGQVLSSPSVTKMIDVIRAHLESASKFYTAAIKSAHNNSSSNPPEGSSHSGLLGELANEPKETAASSDKTGLNRVIQGEQIDHNMADIPSSCNRSSESALKVAESSVKLTEQVKNQHLLSPLHDPKKKAAEFRRISSVSYNDEQLINDLCRTEKSGLNDKEANNHEAKPAEYESPWRYEELSAAYKQNSRQKHKTTSESSLDTRNSTTLDLMNDSGIGTIYDFNTDDFSSLKVATGGNCAKPLQIAGKRHSLKSNFKPKQQPPYMSTDDYVSQLADAEQSGSLLYNSCKSCDIGDVEKGCLKCDANEHQQQPVDVASRRAELEWTLNKLINFELKYTWLVKQDTLRRAIRRIGVPNEIRGKVWLILIEQLIGTEYDALKLLDEASKTIVETTENSCSPGADEETHSILKQIDLDVNRTMPGHKLFDDGAEGGVKLRRILVAYSIHINRAIAYCQGFNFIVALLLSVFDGDEEKSLRGFVCIVDHVFPSKFYFDHYLTGARADQFLLADFICNQLIKNPSLAERKIVEGVTSSITLNWFISLFHGAVPTLTRLTILDHFMLDGVKALFRFTMAILYLAFQITPPSSCEVFTTIRNTARDMYDIKLLLSIVEQIKLPKDSYFAIRRSFYMVQSSFNSDQFYMQSLSNDASRQFVTNRPLSLQQLPETKPPAMSLITAASLVAQQSIGINGDYQQNFNANNNTNSGSGPFGPRTCTSSDRSKVCIQNIGKLGRSHIRIIDANVRSNERSLMSPLRNCLVIGISNCGKIVIVARQSSRRMFKSFKEQDLTFHVHELSTEIFDGFYLEDSKTALILTYLGEIFKIDTSKCYADSLVGSTETLMLRDSHPIGDNEKVKLKLASVDSLTNLLWVCIECEETASATTKQSAAEQSIGEGSGRTQVSITKLKSKYKSNNPFLCDLNETITQRLDSTQPRLHESFGDVIKMRTSLVSFCQLANPMSNQFSSRIVRIGPTGRYEHLLSFADVVDFMISVPESCTKWSPESSDEQQSGGSKVASICDNRYSTLNKFLARSISFNAGNENASSDCKKTVLTTSAGTLTNYYRSLMKSHSTASGTIEGIVDGSKLLIASKNENPNQESNTSVTGSDRSSLPNVLIDDPCRAIITSYLGNMEDVVKTNYMPVNMAFIFRNGKIALFEFTESYAIHTRESQLDRYDYSRVINVNKHGDDFIITILTIFDKLIKVVI